MRTLNKRQKKILDNWFNKNWTGAGSIGTVEDLPIEIFEELERINDHETLYTNVNCYISDKAMTMVHVNTKPSWLR